MASVNKVLLVGHLGADPEVRYAPSGDAIATLRLATSEQWKDKASGERREATEWHRVVFFGRTAEVAGEYLRKGSLVYVEGRLQTRKWQDKDGSDRYTTEVRGDAMKMLGGRPGGDGGSERPARERAPAETERSSAKTERSDPGGFGDFDDDIPFAPLGAGAAWRVV